MNHLWVFGLPAATRGRDVAASRRNWTIPEMDVDRAIARRTNQNVEVADFITGPKGMRDNRMEPTER
jgi:hypothetical protein